MPPTLTPLTALSDRAYKPGVRRIVALVLAALTPALASGSQTLAGGPLNIHAVFRNGDQAACYIRNIGTKPVSLHAEFIYFVSGRPDFPPSFEDCNQGPLAPGRTCVLLINTPAVVECAVTVSGGGSKSLRGPVEIRRATPSGPVVVESGEMR